MLSTVRMLGVEFDVTVLAVAHSKEDMESARELETYWRVRSHLCLLKAYSPIRQRSWVAIFTVGQAR